MSRLAPFAIGLALGLGIAVGIGALRRPEPPRDRHRIPIQDVLDYHADALGLDQATLDEVWAIVNGAREELDGYRASVRAHREELARILDADRIDRAGMAAAVASIGERESRLRIRELEVMLEIRALLTRDQIDALEQLGAPPPPRRP